MTTYKADIRWELGSSEFTIAAYDRSHVLAFTSGQELKASAAPEYQGDAEKVNPEELLAASLSSCHMLTFLALATKKKLVVQSYHATAIATLGKNSAGKMAVTDVVIRPDVNFAGTPPSQDEIMALHEKAHGHCFISNSVNFPVRVEM